MSANPDSLVTTQQDSFTSDSTWKPPDEPGLGEPAIDPVGGLIGVVRGIMKKGVLHVVKEVLDSVRDDLAVESAKKAKEKFWKENEAEEPEAETETDKKKK